VAKAAAALAGTHVVERAETSGGQLGWLAVTLVQADGRPPEDLVHDALRTLLDAQVPVLSFELEGARLSDAFLAMTEPG
jgi:ABC-2 type transport system ATP-binding protein